MLVESRSSMKDSKSRRLGRHLKAQDYVEWIKWMKYLFVQDSKESTRQTESLNSIFLKQNYRSNVDRERYAINYTSLHTYAGRAYAKEVI